MEALFGPWEALPQVIQIKYENTVAFFNAQYGGRLSADVP
jgi:hypothetical protein